MRYQPENDRGFTLIEVLAAFLIATLTLAALFRLVGGGLRATSTLEGRTIALIEARSLLAEVGISRPLQTGSREGILPEGGRWSIEIVEAEVGPDQVFALFEVVVDVIRDDGGAARLSTLRVGSAEISE